MRKIFFVSLILFGFVGGKLNAQNYQVHSLYIYSFTKYVKWPPEYGEGDFVIGVLGKSMIKQHLKKMASLKKVGNRLIRVVEYQSKDDIEKCNILFISRNKSDEFAAIREKMKSIPTLILTEKEGLGKKGSAINFIIKDKRLLFEMNKSVIEECGLKISQELVKYAIII